MCLVFFCVFFFLTGVSNSNNLVTTGICVSVSIHLQRSGGLFDVLADCRHLFLHFELGVMSQSDYLIECGSFFFVFKVVILHRILTTV